MKTAMPAPRVVFRLFVFLLMLLPLSVSPMVATDRMSASEGHGHGLPSLDLADEDCLPKFPPPPVVKIHVRVPACSDPGQTIKYRICVENCSTAEAHHVVVKNALPANAKFVKADPEPSKQGPELQWNLGTIGGGGVREIILVLQPTNKEDVKNCARVQFEHGQCVTTRQTGSAPGARPPIISTVPDVPKTEDLPVLDLDVRGPKDQYINLPSKYEITVTNKGKTKATNTEVRALVSDKLKVLRVSAPGVDAKNLVEWKLGNLEPGASQRLELTLQATEKGTHCFKVAAEADLGVKKEMEFCTKFAGVSALSVDLSDEDPAFVGQKLRYPFAVTSRGSAAVTNIRVRALVPAALKLDKTTPPQFDKREPAPGGEWIEFALLPKIEAGHVARYEIVVEAMQAGVTRMHIEVTADQLDAGRPVIVEEGTTVVDEREKVGGQK